MSAEPFRDSGSKFREVSLGSSVYHRAMNDGSSSARNPVGRVIPPDARFAASPGALPSVPPSGSAAATRAPGIAGSEQAAGRSAVRPLGISLPLWTLLAVSVGFFIGVRQYVHYLDVVPLPSETSEVRFMSVQGPAEPVTAGNLWLHWDPVPEAATYHLHIHTAGGDPIVDPLPVPSTTWNPEDAVLPALEGGTYRWQVEALDGAGHVIARSMPAPLSISG